MRSSRNRHSRLAPSVGGCQPVFTDDGRQGQHGPLRVSPRLQGIAGSQPEVGGTDADLGVPQSTRSDGGGEFTAQVVSHLSRRLNLSLNHGPADFTRSQGAVERVGGWLQEVLSILCQKWRCGGINMCSPLAESSG